MAILNDFVSEVTLNLGNRTDIAPRVSIWLRDAYIDLTMTVPFEELQFTFDDIFQPTIDIYDYPTDARAIVTLSLSPSMANPSTSQPIKRRNIQVVRRYSTSMNPGVPAIYAPFNRKILVRPVPNLAYPFKWDYWQLPQIDPTNSLDTIVLTPLDWNEIITYMATMRGHLSLLERDKAAEIHTLLYGDPKNVDEPGLIKKKLLIHAAENYDSDYGIRPRVRPYTSKR